MTNSSICSRSIAAVFALSISALLAPGVLGQTTATTVPVGFITKSIPAAIDAVTPSNTVLSAPMYQTADFQSSVSATPGVGSHDISLNSSTFGVGQFSATPHLVRVKSGSLVGKFWLIVANTANSVTLQEPNGGASPGVADANLTGLLAGDSCEILPANTLATLFGASGGGLVTGASASGADNIYIWNGAGWDTYYNNGTNWKKGAFTNANNLVVYPDDAMFVSHIGVASVALTVMGTVPSTSELTELNGSSVSGPGITFMANRFPVDTTLGATGLQNSPNWLTGNTASSADNVYLWNGAGWDTYYHNGTNWKKGAFTNANAVVVPAGEGLYVSRTSSTSSSVAQALPYTP